MGYRSTTPAEAPMCKALGASHREGLALLQVTEMPDEAEEARAWIEELCWPQGPCCPHHGSAKVQCNTNRARPELGQRQRWTTSVLDHVQSNPLAPNPVSPWVTPP